MRYSNRQKINTFLALLSFSTCKMFNVEGNIRTISVSISILKLFFLIYFCKRERKGLKFFKYFGWEIPYNCIIVGHTSILKQNFFATKSPSKVFFISVCACSFINYIGFDQICHINQELINSSMECCDPPEEVTILDH